MQGCRSGLPIALPWANEEFETSEKVRELRLSHDLADGYLQRFPR